MENVNMEQVLLFATVIAPIVAALVQLIKKTINMPVNILPVISVIAGILIGISAYPFTDLDTVLRIWAGGFAGLSGTGLYEMIKKRDGNSQI